MSNELLIDRLFSKDFLKQLFTLRLPKAEPPRLVDPGLYHMMRDVAGTPARFHLRVDADGSGMLLANASAAARLSISGVFIAKRLFDGVDDEVILRELETHFSSGNREAMRSDIARVRSLMDTLAAPTSDHPIVKAEGTVFSLYEAQLIAPLQASLPLADPDMLLPILNRLWEVGIPQVHIIVPARPEPGALVHVIERAEDLGMIAGVRGRASDLQDRTLLRDMAMAGVDYITVPYASTEPQVHDTLYGKGDHRLAEQVFSLIRNNEVCPVAKVPLLETTVDDLNNIFARLARADITNVSLFAIAVPDDQPEEQRDGALSVSELLQIGSLLEDIPYQLPVNYVWQVPVLRNPDMTLATQVQQGPRCAEDVAILVEADGSVIPATGPYRSVGNLLRDPWESIWSNPAFRIYRERVAQPEAAESYAQFDHYTETYLKEQAA